MQNKDLIRELEKIANTLGHLNSYLRSQSEANATLHLSNEVLYPPLTAATGLASRNITDLINRLREDGQD